eukprot:scaffold87314_cov20-Tisochrysis_lutea.AAC.3
MQALSIHTLNMRALNMLGSWGLSSCAPCPRAPAARPSGWAGPGAGPQCARAPSADKDNRGV